MKKIITMVAIIATGIMGNAQVGIGTKNPKATLDVVGAASDVTKADGIIAPRLTRAELTAKDDAYDLAQTGTSIYVTDVSGGTAVGKRINITQVGYYYFDGAIWQALSSLNKNIYSDNGALSGNRVVTQGANTLAFTSTAVNGFSIDASTFSVDASNNRVGIGTATPAVNLHVTNPTAIGNLPNNLSELVKLQSNLSGNTGYLNIFNRRHTAGTNWDGTQTKIQRQIGGTPMGFIDFGIDGLTSNYGLGFGSGTNTRMVITAAGDVGIGTTAPVKPLHVSNAVGSGIKISSPATIASQLDSNDGTINAGTFTAGLNIVGIRTEASPKPRKVYVYGEASGDAGLAVVYDLKYGMQTTDHNGWYLLNGRNCNTFTAGTGARARCEAKWGVGGVMPNANNASGANQNSATYFANIDGNVATVAGSIGGNTDNLWGNVDLPQHTHSGTSGNNNQDINHLHTGSTAGAGAHTHQVNTFQNVESGKNGPDFGWLKFSFSRTTSAAGDHAHNFTTNGADRSLAHTHSFTTNNGNGLNNSLVPTTPRTLDANAFVYLGL